MPRRNRRYEQREPRLQRRGAERSRDRDYVRFIAGRDADDDVDTDLDLDCEQSW